MAGAVLFGAGISLLVCAVLVPVLIPVLRRLKFGQEIREEGPAWHAKKKRNTHYGRYSYRNSCCCGDGFVRDCF